jgi:uncharacterized protein
MDRQAGAGIPWVAPFAVFIGVMAVEKALNLSPGIFYPVRTACALATLLAVSRQVIPWRPARPLASIAVGIGVFVIWIGPDLLWPGWREHWLFHNPLLGSASSSLPGDLKTNAAFIAVRVFGSVGLVPIVEELFWRGWLMRWLITPQFQKVPLGAYAPLSFWATALLFASEHGSYWEVGLIAGIVYNWWLIRTRNLADCILAHAVTNACLAAYVLARGQWQYWL